MTINSGGSIKSRRKKGIKESSGLGVGNEWGCPMLLAEVPGMVGNGGIFF
jgi:hypothetical protein